MENFQKMEHKYPQIMFMIPNYQKKKKKETTLRFDFTPQKGNHYRKEN